MVKDMTVDGSSMATVRDMEGESEAPQTFVEKRITNRTRQGAGRASEAADSDEPDPPSSKRSNGKREGKKSGRSKVVEAETTRCRETYAVGIAAVLQAGDVTSW
jgi:hypothetical protein